MKINIARINESSTLSSQMDYAVQEICLFLEKFTTVTVTENEEDFDAGIELYIDEMMESHCYTLHGDGTILKISGGNASSVLCGVYEALADAGILFEATGYSVCDRFDLDGFLRVKKAVHPKCRLRGIRQHINFPMDISSYSLKDAQEYIRALARMRFNAITFHSYGGQWHATEPDNPENVAGHFFYGQHHSVTTNDPLTAGRIHNRYQYCIPEAESFYDDEKTCGEYATYWLQELMKTVKEVGMELTLSVELPFDETEKNQAMLHEIVSIYPWIDTLELITFENGNKGQDFYVEDLAPENIKKAVVKAFGTRILKDDGSLEGEPDHIPAALPGSIACYKRMFEVVDHKEAWLEGLSKTPALRVGIYVTDAKVLSLMWPILRKCLPEGVTKSLLPAHGALAVAQIMEKIGVSEEDWQNTMFYSWAEFDGNMYIQQLSTDGLEKIATMSAAEDVYGICINHWRTSENTMTISYAAKNFITPMTTTEYYREFAKEIKIKEVDDFTAACDRLAKLDTYNRENLFNIGFCHAGYWLSSGMNRLRRFAKEAQDHAIEEYESLANVFARILQFTGTKEAIALIRLLHNRCQTSALHVRSMQKLGELYSIYDYEKMPEPTEGQRKEALEICEKSREYAQKFIHLYGEMLPDRGCQGLIVSYYETIPVFIDMVENRFDGASSMDNPADVFDAPPSPDEIAKNTANAC